MRKGGIIEVKVDGKLYSAKGSFTYNHGAPKRDAIVGADVVHGYKEMPQVSFVEGEITDSQDLDVPALKAIKNATVTLSLANGKVFVLKNAWYASEGDVETEEGNIGFRFEGMNGDEVR